jgi:hypothetical protein
MRAAGRDARPLFYLDCWSRANVLPIILAAQKQGASLKDIADALNARAVRTPRGRRYASAMKNVPARALDVQTKRREALPR